jgi:hypothetical protein
MTKDGQVRVWIREGAEFGLGVRKRSRCDAASDMQLFRQPSLVRARPNDGQNPASIDWFDKRV